jgi:hypothetical protein
MLARKKRGFLLCDELLAIVHKFFQLSKRKNCLKKNQDKKCMQASYLEKFSNGKSKSKVGHGRGTRASALASM